MSTTMLIARLLLPIFVLVTIAILIRPKRFKNVAKEIANNAALIHIVSIINIMLGTLVILYHNVRSQDRSVVITILGWLAFIKGAIYMLFPNSVESVANMAANKTTMYVIAVITALLSAAMFMLSGLR